MSCKIIHLLLAIILYSSPAICGAVLLNFNYTRNIDKNWSETFEIMVENLYGEISSWAPDKESFSSIEIRFTNLDGYKGYTNHPRQILIDQSFENSLKARKIFAHEFTHILRHQYNPDEELWVRELIGKTMEYHLAGFDKEFHRAGAQWKPDLSTRVHSLKSITLSNSEESFSPEGSGYDIVFLLGQYLYEKFGREKFLSQLLVSPYSGWKNIVQAAIDTKIMGIHSIPDKVLSSNGIWKHFALSFFLNDASLTHSLSVLNYKNFKSVYLSENSNVANSRLSNLASKNVTLGEFAFENLDSQREIQSFCKKYSTTAESSEGLSIYAKNRSSNPTPILIIKDLSLKSCIENLKPGGAAIGVLSPSPTH